MKSILSKTMKYPKSKPMPTTKTKTTVEPQPNRSRIDIHEISTQSIMQTSALLHLNNHHDIDDEVDHHNTSVVITPTNESIVGRTLTEDDASDALQSYDTSVSEKDDDDDDSSVMVVVEDVKMTDIDSNKGHRDSVPSLSFLEPNDMVISEECSVRVSSPLGEPKEVRFLGEEDRRRICKITLDESCNDDDDEAVHRRHSVRFQEEEDHELEKESFVLHEQLRNVLQDLSAEKAIRFQKEKSLVKLAKQLKKRNLAIDVYETKLIQMAKFINALKLELQQLRDEKERQERKLVQQRTSEEVKTSTATEQSKRIDSLQDTIQSLGAELQESQRQVQQLHEDNQLKIDEIPMVEAKVSMTTSHLTKTIHRRAFMTMLFVVGLSLVAMMQYHTKSSTMVQNILCAPIRPGTKLIPNSSAGSNRIYEAPWWVPDTVHRKPMIYATFCSLVPRTSVHWTGDKLMIFDITAHHPDRHYNTNNNKKVLLLQGRGPAGVQFNHYSSSDSDGTSSAIIQLLRTHRAGIALPAPWILL